MSNPVKAALGALALACLGVAMMLVSRDTDVNLTGRSIAMVMALVGLSGLLAEWWRSSRRRRRP